MISEIRLRNFKAFSNFKISFKDTSFLVGPNSAGKSTILTAIRSAETCLRLAKRLKPTEPREHLGSWHMSYPVPLRDFAALNESVRYDFREAETSLELRWKNKCKLRVIWPELRAREDSETPFFYLLDDVGNVPRSPALVKAKFSTIGVIPTLSPLEHEEAIVEDETVRRNLSSRLSSRNFRNQLRMLVENGSWNEFIEFATPWLAEIRLTPPVIRYDTSSIDVFFSETGSRIEKELVWAGDGVQIWIQLLLHIYRAQYLPTLVLDEPEVFLHADLQRRLVRLLGSRETQVILATHSTEVLAEADRRTILWVDKTQPSAVRAPEHEALTELDTALGTAFNLAMAKALRARGVLFVEGKDTKLLKRIAETLGISQLSDESTLAVVPMNGFSKWDRAQAFGWFLREFLGNSVKALVLLDRDYRTDSQVSDVMAEFASVNVDVHVWNKKELESYLLIPDVIARLSKCAVEEITAVIDRIMDDIRNKVTSRLLFERVEVERSTGKSVSTINEEVLNEVEKNWANKDFRYAVCPPKQIMAGVNGHLQANGFKAVSFDAIAKYAQLQELDPELVQLLRKIEALAD